MGSSEFSLIALMFLFGILVMPIGASVAGERKECAEKLIGLAMCLNHVSGRAKSPSPDCCAGLKTVVETKAKCLCIVVKDRDPNLGLKFDPTIALNIPNACHVPLNLTTRIDLLQLAPNSTDARVFSDIEKILDRLKNSTNGHGTSSTTSTSEFQKANAWKEARWRGLLEIVVATFLSFSTPYLIAYV